MSTFLPSTELEIVPVVLDYGAEHIAAYREESAHHVLGGLLAVDHEEELAVRLDQLGTEGPLETHRHPAVPLTDAEICTLVHLGDDSRERRNRMLEVAVHAHGVVGVGDLEPLENGCTEPPGVRVTDVERDERVVQCLDLLSAAVRGVVIHEEDLEIGILRPDRSGDVGDVLLLVVCGDDYRAASGHGLPSDMLSPNPTTQMYGRVSPIG